jgi:hypothetical protein
MAFNSFVFGLPLSAELWWGQHAYVHAIIRHTGFEDSKESSPYAHERPHRNTVPGACTACIEVHPSATCQRQKWNKCRFMLSAPRRLWCSARLLFISSELECVMFTLCSVRVS